MEWSASNNSSVLRQLRARLPNYFGSLGDARITAERLADDLLLINDVSTFPVSETLVNGLPKLTVERGRLPRDLSGSTTWDRFRSQWVIVVNDREPHLRQRLSVFHEFFHVVTHTATERGAFTSFTNGQVEELADYFAGCVLAPTTELASFINDGHTNPVELSSYFRMSRQAIDVRLRQVRPRARAIRAIRLQSEQVFGPWL